MGPEARDLARGRLGDRRRRTPWCAWFGLTIRLAVVLLQLTDHVKVTRVPH